MNPATCRNTPLVCLQCAGQLSATDIGAHRKFVNRGAREFMCLPCLAAYFGVREDCLREKIEEFKKAGCTLFL